MAFELEQKKICLYGLGAIGKFLFDELHQNNIDVDFIIDKKLAGGSHNETEIISLDEARKRPLDDYKCIVSLHNHYVDLLELNNELVHASFEEVISVIKLKDYLPDLNLENAYWLDYKIDFDKHTDQIESVSALFNDIKSKEIFKNIIHYRATGSFEDYPNPSMTDEYTPRDLPKYKSPLNIIDCGAYTGVAINKLDEYGYKFNNILALEPDLINYSKLIKNKVPANLKCFLPLASFSDNKILKFASNNGMSSKLTDEGDVSIQAVKIDSIQDGIEPNLIKFDVEGAEVDTLLGARTTIMKHRPNLCVSVYHRPYDIFEIPTLIHNWDLNYKFYLRVHEHNSFGVVLYCLQDHLIESSHS